jgi:hypothetical protein
MIFLAFFRSLGGSLECRTLALARCHFQLALETREAAAAKRSDVEH